MDVSQLWSGFSQPTPRVALVIRDQAVELLERTGGGRRAAATTHVRVPIEAGGLAAAIRGALDRAQVTTKRVAVSLPSQEVLLRFFSMPAIPKGEWDSAVQFEARKYIPFKTEELVWDAHVTPSKTSGKLDVIFAAIKREAFTAIQAALTSAQLEPTLLEPRSMSLARLAASEAVAPRGDFVCLVDLESESAHLTIARDGVPYLARDMSFSPAPPQTEGAPEDVTDPRAQRLLSELSVSIDFFTREYASAGMTKIWLFGEESLIAPWCRWLADQLRCPVALGTPLLAKAASGGLPLSFAAAVGALSATRNRRGASLDFLKRTTAKPATSAARLAAKAVPDAKGLAALLKTPQAAVMACVLAALLMGVWFFGGGRVEAKRRQLRQLTQSAPHVGWALDGMSKEALAPIAANVESQLTLLTQLMDQRVSVAAKMDALARSLPEGVWLTGLTYADRADGSAGQHLRALVRGACFLGNDGSELDAIQELENRMKRNARFFTGFSTSRLEEIAAQQDYQREYTYRTFQLNCSSEQKL